MRIYCAYSVDLRGTQIVKDLLLTTLLFYHTLDIKSNVTHNAVLIKEKEFLLRTHVPHFARGSYFIQKGNPPYFCVSILFTIFIDHTFIFTKSNS